MNPRATAGLFVAGCLAAAVLACAGPVGAATLEAPGELRVEYAENPLGLETRHPRMSWKLRSARHGDRQTAHQILVASSAELLQRGKADLWDTGRVAGDRSIQVPYQGAALVSRQRCFWKVRVWDADGNPTDYSPPASWEMGLLEPGDWQAEWIGNPAGWNGRALYFRLDFTKPKEIESARIYVAGLGCHELRLNGAKVGDNVLDPGFTDYGKRVLYVTHDVTAGLRPGKNILAAIVGNGWYGMPKLLLQLEITHPGGAREVIATGGARADSATRWRVGSGPIVANSIYDGETYDARLEKEGWDAPAMKPPDTPPDRLALWMNAMPVDPPRGRMVSQYNEPIRVVETLAPEAPTEPRPGIFVFDAGQNLAGWAELRVQGPRGTAVTLRFAETLYPDGTVNQENLRAAAATDIYILKGGDLETWQPRFTYHGFRYVQVEGFPGRPAASSLSIRRVRSAVEPNGSFECSNELVNRIQRMVWNTEAANLHSIPTDCPQRNERMGWMNDLTVRLEESLSNFDLARFHNKFLDDVADTQAEDGSITDTAPFKWGKRPADPVSASYLLLGWFLYQYYGDTAALAAHYDGFKAWVDYVAGRAEEYIVPYGSWGDWSPPATESVPGTVGSGALSRDTPLPFMSTGYLHYTADLLARMARVLGKRSDERRYRALARNVADAFNRKYWNEATGGYGSNNQACNSFALFLGVVPEADVPRVVENLARDVEQRDGHLSTGNLCTKYLLETLADHGRSDLAYRITTRETYPGWGFMLANGATTLWERWEHQTGSGMNSHNHPMMGSVSSWFYKYLAGIQGDPSAPGFKHFRVRPQVVEGLDWVKASYTSMYGVIRSEWRREGGGLVLKVGVPVNTSAAVHLPERWGADITVMGKPADVARRDGGERIVELGSGDHELTVR